MKPKMRRKLKKTSALFFALIILVFVALLGVIRFRPQGEKIIVNTNLTQQSSVNLNKSVIDLSGWQQPENIDYNVLSQQVIGAIIRVQGNYGNADASATSNGEDTAYKQHISEFQKRGVPVAVYAFVTGKNTQEMKQQAKDFYNRAKSYHPTYYWLDVEVTNMKDMNAGIEAFRAELASLGVKNIGIYAQDWFIQDNKINTSKFNAIWMADYGRNTGVWDVSPTTTLPYDMQQYTDKGKIFGYSGNVDLSVLRSQTEYDKLFKNTN